MDLVKIIQSSKFIDLGERSRPHINMSVVHFCEKGRRWPHGHMVKRKVTLYVSGPFMWECVWGARHDAMALYSNASLHYKFVWPFMWQRTRDDLMAKCSNEGLDYLMCIMVLH